MGLTKAIIDNINMSSANYIEIFLREQNLQRTSSEEGMDTRSWVNLLLQSGRLNEDTFERFLQEEARRLQEIRICVRLDKGFRTI